MSTLIENVAKVTAAHAALKAAIASKGVAVPEGTRLSEMPALIEQINTSAETNHPRASFSGDTETTIVVPKVLVVDLTSATNLTNCFSGCSSLVSLTLPDGFGQAATHLANCFYGCYSLTSLTLPDGFGQAATNLSGCFNGCSALVSLTLPSGFGQAATNLSGCFNGCSSLATISGNPNFELSLDLSSCTKLQHDSIMVVINGLQTVTTSQTLKLGEINLSKITDDEKKVATDKGWTLA